MPLLFLGVFLVFATSASAQTPVSPPDYFAAPGTQSPVAAASDGSNFLLLWTDTRPAAGLYAARFGNDGTVTDRVGMPVAYGSVAHAVAFWNGTSYSIYWEDDAGIWLRHLLTNGTFDPRVLVVPQGHASTNRFAALGPGGIVAIVHDSKIGFTENSGSAIQTTVSVPNATAMSVASAGNEFFAVWLDGTDVFGERFFADGTPKSDAFILTTAGVSEGTPLIFGGNNQYLLLTTGSTIFARVIGATTGAGSRINLGPGSSPSAASLGNGFQVVFANGGAAFATTITSSGAGPVSAVAAAAQTPQVATNGRDTFVAWADRTTPRDVNGYILGRTNPTRISSAAQNQTQPAIAFGGGVFGVAWTETLPDGQSTTVRFQRVSGNGAVLLDGSGITLGSTSEVNSSPSVVFDGANFVVAFNATRTTSAIATARITPAGTLLDGTAGVHQAENVCSAPALAADKIGAAVAYIDCGFGNIHLLRVTGAGSGQNMLVTPPGGILTLPRLASNGDEFLVVWESERRILASRVTSSMQVIDTQPLVVTVDGQHAEVAAIGTGFAVVWEAISYVWIRFIDSSGNFTSPAIAVAVGTVPRVTADGSQAALTYIRDGVAWLAHFNGGDEHPIATSATEAAYLASAGGNATLYASIMRDLVYGGVNRVFVSITGAPPVPRRHRAVRK